MRLFGTLLLILAATGCGPSRPPRAPNVVLICIDTLRADHLGCYGYQLRETTPCLDRLAEAGTLFADTSATAGWTKPSVPSFLTGTYPARHGVYEGSAHDVAGEVSHALPAAAITLAEVFEQSGYDTAAFVRNAQLRTGLGFEQGFALYRDEAGDAREIRWRAQDWLDTRAREHPFFLYLHYLDVHWPWPVPDEYAGRFAPLERVQPQRDRLSGAVRDAINHGERELTPTEREDMLALYDGSLRYVDDQLAELFAWMDRRGDWQDTIVCVVADHGEEFGEHGRVGHGHGLFEGLLQVPWIMRIPGRAPVRVTHPVSLVDLFPTLLAAAGLDAPANDGIDRLATPERAAPILAEHKEPRAYQQSLRSGTTKLVRRFRLLRAPSSPPRPVPGRRYDIDLAGRDDGSLVAVKIQPGEGSPGDLPELKGSIEALTGQEILIAGVRVRLAPAAEVYGEVAAGSGPEILSVGMLVKVPLVRSGVELLASRVKVYAPSAQLDLELRAELESFEGSSEAGRLVVCGLQIEVDATTTWKDIEDPRQDLSREQLLELQLAGAQQTPGFESWRTRFDLAADPQELGAGAEVVAGSELDLALDALFADLAGRRYWSVADRAGLDAQQLEALRALGY